MNETTPTLSTFRRPSRDDISHKARELWESYGRPAGRDEEIWLEAERQLQQPGPTEEAGAAQAAPTSATTTAPAAPPVNTTARASPRGSTTATPRGARKR